MLDVYYAGAHLILQDICDSRTLASERFLVEAIFCWGCALLGYEAFEAL